LLPGRRFDNLFVRCARAIGPWEFARRLALPWAEGCGHSGSSKAEPPEGPRADVEGSSAEPIFAIDLDPVAARSLHDLPGDKGGRRTV
jgi:hypothetical protein